MGHNELKEENNDLCLLIYSNLHFTIDIVIKEPYVQMGQLFRYIIFKNNWLYVAVLATAYRNEWLCPQ